MKNECSPILPKRCKKILSPVAIKKAIGLFFVLNNKENRMEKELVEKIEPVEPRYGDLLEEGTRECLGLEKAEILQKAGWRLVESYKTDNYLNGCNGMVYKFKNRFQN